MGKVYGKDARRLRLSALACALVAFGVALAAHAGLYKWIDEKGGTHYSDSVPPEYVNRGAVEFGKRGTQVRSVEPALTPEQVKAREDEQAKKRDAAKVEAEQKRRDAALLNSYTNDKQIDDVRNRNISIVDGVIATTQHQIAEARKRWQGLDAERTNLAKSGKSLTAIQQRELKSIEDQLPLLEKVVAGKLREVEILKAKYDSDLKRYRELTGAQSAAR